jgi:Cu+-exporting ATPase
MENIHKPIDLNNNQIINLQQQGKTVIIIEVNKKQIGLIALSDTLKSESRELIKILHKLNIKTVMLTGDNHLTAKYIANQLSIDEAISFGQNRDPYSLRKSLLTQRLALNR